MIMKINHINKQMNFEYFNENFFKDYLLKIILEMIIYDFV